MDCTALSRSLRKVFCDDADEITTGSTLKVPENLRYMSYELIVCLEVDAILPTRRSVEVKAIYRYAFLVRALWTPSHCVHFYVATREALVMIAEITPSHWNESSRRLSGNGIYMVVTKRPNGKGSAPPLSLIHISEPTSPY